MRRIARSGWVWPGVGLGVGVGSLVGWALLRSLRGRSTPLSTDGSPLGAGDGNGTMAPESDHLPPDARMGIQPDPRVDQRAAKTVGNDPPGWLP